MAEFELRMKENNPAQAAGLLAMAVLFPLWGLAIPGGLILFIILLLSLPANVPIGLALAVVAGLALTSIICAVITFFLEDDQIRISKQGLSFPLSYFSCLKMKLQRSWDDLTDLKLKWQRESKFNEQDSMLLIFRGGGMARLPLHRFADSDLEQFFIAFESCASGCQRDADLDDLEYALQTRKTGSLPSYTQLWERSLSNRFSGATFTPLEPGSKVHQYHILRQLGFGGFAAVYLARSNNGNNVVLKESVFPQNDNTLSKAEELFRREAAILSRLSHPNIARVYDYFIENDRHYMCMDYIEGTDLNRLLLREGPLPVAKVLDHAINLAEILSYLHGLSPPVVHRDISPENLVIRSDGSLALIDFGAAKEIASSFTGTIIGKQAYIAPEQFRGKPGTASDIYAMGATLYFVLTGKSPEPLTSSSPLACQPEIPQELDKLIAACTQIDETIRPDANEVLAQLNRIKSGETQPDAIALNAEADKDTNPGMNNISPASTL